MRSTSSVISVVVFGLAVVQLFIFGVVSTGPSAGSGGVSLKGGEVYVMRRFDFPSVQETEIHLELGDEDAPQHVENSSS